MNNIIALEDTKTELLEAQGNMRMNLPEKISELELTVDELEALREQLKDEVDTVIAEAEKTFHIRKKLNYLVNDYNVFEQIRVAIDVLNESIEYHKNLKE